MTPEQYMVGVERTLLKNGTLPPLWAPALGLGGEVGELVGALEWKSREEVKLEMGDVLWYVFAAVRSAGLSLEEVLRHCRHSESLHTQVHVGEYVDYVKKICWHGKPQDNAHLELLLGNILACLHEEALCAQLDLWNEVAVANIEKLKRRYPEGFRENAT